MLNMNYKILHLQIKHIKEKLKPVNSEKKVTKNLYLKMKIKKMNFNNKFWELEVKV